MGNDVPAISPGHTAHTEKPSGYEFTRNAGDGLQEFKSAWERRWVCLAGAAGTEVTVTTTTACADERQQVSRGISGPIRRPRAAWARLRACVGGHGG
jgi:hypothetical protein